LAKSPILPTSFCAIAARDEDFDIEIVEMHHNKKIDVPA
jgi:dihydrodipicolinate reductase